MRWALLLLLVGCDLSFSSKVSTINDAGFEAPTGCPGNFNTLPNSGPRGHRYLSNGVVTTWTNQRDNCAALGSFLSFPDGATPSDAALELAATTTLAGAGHWVGINDIVAEGTYRTVTTGTVSASTASFIQTGAGANAADCLAGNQSTLTDEDCGEMRGAVCECVP